MHTTTNNTIIDSDDTPHNNQKNKPWTSKELIDLGAQIALERCTVFKNQMGIPHVAMPWKMQGSTQTRYEPVPIRDAKFGSWIALEVKASTGCRLSESDRKGVITAIADEANQPETSRCPTYTRVAPGDKGAIYIDLGDESASVIKVSAQGVHLCPTDESPLFVRPQGASALPNPIAVSPNLDLLKKYVNLPGNDGWVLMLVYVLYALRAMLTYPILMISGAAGSSKTTLCRIFNMLIDPSTPEIYGMPRSEHDLVIAASNSYLLILDNLHKVPQNMSDCFCRLATGGGFRVRQLYSDNAEMLFDVVRPQIFNGIQGYADQSDLLDRSIHLDLPAIKQDNRQTEQEFWSAFQKDYASIFAGLLDALSKALKILPRLKGESPVRMADFYFFGCAVEVALGWEEGTFHDALLANQSKMMEETTADDPLAQAIFAMVAQCIPPGAKMKRTSTLWLDVLANHVDDKIQKNAKLWPQSPHALGKRLRPLIPALYAQGIGLEFLHSGERKIVFTNIGK